MTCEEAWVLMNGHLDGENTPAEEAQLREHLDHCASCREMLQLLTEGDAAILSLQEDAPADLCSNVMQQIRREKPRKRKSWKRWTGLAVAAALVLTIGAAQLRPQQEESQAVYGARMTAEPALPSTASFMMEEENPDMEMAVQAAQQMADEKTAAVLLLEEEVDVLQEKACLTDEHGWQLVTLASAEEAEALQNEYSLPLFLPADGAEPEQFFALLIP